jgi:hypothetical protein
MDGRIKSGHDEKGASRSLLAMTVLFAVMPALGAGIHAFMGSESKSSMAGLESCRPAFADRAEKR